MKHVFDKNGEPVAIYTKTEAYGFTSFAIGLGGTTEYHFYPTGVQARDGHEYVLTRKVCRP